MIPGYARLYLTNRRGRTHLVDASYVSHRALALCGVHPALGLGWLGLGNDVERERAAQRRICGDCARVLKRLGPKEEPEMDRPEWTKGALTVGALKKHLENVSDDVIVSFPIDSEGNDFKYAVDVTLGYLMEDCGQFVLVDLSEPDRDLDDPDYVSVIFIEPYN